MALVGVEHLGVDAEGLERPHTTHAEQDLLPQSVLDVTTVEAVGDGAHLLGVLVDVGVQQVQGNPAHVGPPDPGDDLGVAQLDLHADVVALRDRHRIRVEVRVGLLLPAVAVERLSEVAVSVEEPDPRERHPQVARGLQVVTGEHAKSTGVLGEGLGDAELGGEVRNLRQG